MVSYDSHRTWFDPEASAFAEPHHLPKHQEADPSPQVRNTTMEVCKLTEYEILDLYPPSCVTAGKFTNVYKGTSGAGSFGYCGKETSV